MNRDKHKASGLTESDAMNDLRLGAARKRLAESRGQEDAIDGVREIVANFLGSEELGLFRVDRGNAPFMRFGLSGSILSNTICGGRWALPGSIA